MYSSLIYFSITIIPVTLLVILSIYLIDTIIPLYSYFAMNVKFNTTTNVLMFDYFSKTYSFRLVDGSWYDMEGIGCDSWTEAELFIIWKSVIYD